MRVMTVTVDHYVALANRVCVSSAASSAKCSLIISPSHLPWLALKSIIHNSIARDDDDDTTSFLFVPPGFFCSRMGKRNPII